LNYNLLHNVALFVDCDFNNYISLKAAQLIGRDMGIGRDHRQRGSDFFSG